MAKTDDKVLRLIKACRHNQRTAQRELYRLYYAYAMTVCLHYSRDKGEAKDILNEGFFKVFTKIKTYNEHQPFKAWLRKIMVNTAIDYLRKYHKYNSHLEIVHLQVPIIENTGFDKLALDDVLILVQQLSPMYRAVFNLYVMEGYSHEEISTKLEISISGSKSNLSRAKAKLREMIGGKEKKLRNS